MNRIAMLRKKGLSQISLSLKLNVSQKMISAYENGKSEPSIATLMQMADIFNTSVDYIIGYTNIRQPIDKTVQMSLNEGECDLLGGYRELSAKHSFESDFRLAQFRKKWLYTKCWGKERANKINLKNFQKK